MNSHRRATLVIFAIAWCSTLLGAQSAPSSSCAEMKKRFAGVAEAVRTKPAAAQIRAYLNFLASFPDDPEDCVSTDVSDVISRAERNLIWLEVGDHIYPPDKILHCNEIEGSSKLCKGTVVDDTPLIPETELLKKGRTLPRSGEARLNVSEAVHAKLIGLFAAAQGCFKTASRQRKFARGTTISRLASCDNGRIL